MDKQKISQSAVSKDGHFIAEVVNSLRDKGYGATPQQLRDYEKYGLLTSEKTKGKFRVYNNAAVERIMFIYDMKLTGMSWREMKAFCMTEGKVFDDNLINESKVWDQEKTRYNITRAVKSFLNKETSNNRQIIMLIKNHNSSCDEIKNRLLKVRDIVEDGLNRIALHKINFPK